MREPMYDYALLVLSVVLLAIIWMDAGMNEYEHQRFRDWEVSCAQKDAAIIQLTASRDAILLDLQKLSAETNRVEAERDEARRQLMVQEAHAGKLTAEREALKAELTALDACSTRDINALAQVQAENEQLRLELAAANRAVGNNVRDNERLRAELAKAQQSFDWMYKRPVGQAIAHLVELCKAAEAVCEDYPSQTHGLRINALRAVLAKVTVA